MVGRVEEESPKIEKAELTFLLINEIGIMNETDIFQSTVLLHKPDLIGITDTSVSSPLLFLKPTTDEQTFNRPLPLCIQRLLPRDARFQ